MLEPRLDDRAWTEAIDRYAARARSRGPGRRGHHGRWVLAGAVVLAIVGSPFAVAATGSAILEGKRNPASGASGEIEPSTQRRTASIRLLLGDAAAGAFEEEPGDQQ